MEMIRPVAVTDAVLTATNVVETPPAVYAGGTTYALGATVSVSTTLNGYDVYTSLQNGNVGHSPASSPTWWHKTGTTYGLYDGAHTYGAGDTALSVGANVHEAYVSAQAANAGHALTDTTWWIDAGADNRKAMFDQLVGTVTTNPDKIDVTLTPNEIVDSIALLSVSAATARVVMTDPATATIVYDQTANLTATSGITDWWSYFFEPIERASDIVFSGMPAILAATIEVILTDTGNVVECGDCIVGLSKYIGDSQFGSSVGIIDYSIKSADAFGHYTIVKRAFSKKGSFTVMVKTQNVDTVVDLLDGYRATPILYIGDTSYGCTIILGFYKDYTMTIQYWNYSVLDLELEGLGQ